MGQRLYIGVSACIWHQDPTRTIFNGRPLFYIEHSMMGYLSQLGAHVVMIPPPSPGSPTLAELVEDFDGIVLHGGVDMSPHTYGETPLRPEWSGDSIRDAYEIELFHRAFEKKKPIFGVCRGAQVINVALGGSLYQDIRYENSSALLHRDARLYEKNEHEIEILPHTRLAKLYPGQARCRINSVHHQGIRKLGSDLTVEAISCEDGIIEAIRYTGSADLYCVGVQWHPEFQVDSDSHLLSPRPLLEAFTSAMIFHKKKVCYETSDL